MMKISVIISAFLLVTGVTCCHAQKEQPSDYNYRKAIELLDADKEEEALSYLNKLIEECPQHSDAYMQRARIHINQNKLTLALCDLDNVIKYWKKGCEFDRYGAYWMRANLYGIFSKYDEALADYVTVYKLIRKEHKELIPKVLLQRARVYHYLQDYEKSDADYRRVLRYDEANQEAMMGLANNLMEREDYQGAIEMANQCEKVDSNFGEIYRLRMQAYDKTGETDKAIDDVLNFLPHTNDPEAGYMGLICKKHLDYALEKVNEEIGNGSDVVGLKLFRAVIHRLNHDYAAAIKEYDALEEEYGVYRIIYFSRSKCYRKIGNYKKAIAEIDKCIEFADGDNYYSLEERVCSYMDTGRYEDAIADLTRMIEIAPIEEFPYYRRGLCYEHLGNDAEAMENYNAGINCGNYIPCLYLARGRQYLKRGDTEAANRDFEEILRGDTIAEQYSCRQFALHLLNRNKEALEWMEKVIDSDPGERGVFYDKACLLSLMNKPEEAIAALRTSFEKGYRSFVCIEHDEDLDAIRFHPDFISLIEEYKAKPILVIADAESE